MTEPTSAQELFKGRRFDREIFVLCVRLYLNFKLSSRDLVQMMAERGIKATGSTSIAPWTKAGRTVDFLLSRRRDIAAAKRFFSRATGQHGVPRVITLDGYARLASGGRQTERGWNATAPRTGAILQVFEQRGRARSSPDKAANPADARIQAIRDGGRDDSGH